MSERTRYYLHCTDTEEVIELAEDPRALHSQVRELEESNTLLAEQREGAFEKLEAAQARITALEAQLLRWGRWTPEHNIEQWLREEQQRLDAAQQRITQLAHENAELLSRNQQLEGALKAIECPVCHGCKQTSVQWGNGYYNHYPCTYCKETGKHPQAQKALNPGVYREWCRDPKRCEDKNSCPKDPTCAD
jgi:hypothetical protein